jgi:dTDP-4-dehydrorhamnose reductase
MLDKTGIYHFSDEGVCSWYDFACAIRDLSGNFCDIRPCHSDEFPSKTRRPHFSVLDKTLVKKTFGITIPHWYSSLKDCISRL